MKLFWYMKERLLFYKILWEIKHKQYHIQKQIDASALFRHSYLNNLNRKLVKAMRKNDTAEIDKIFRFGDGINRKQRIYSDELFKNRMDMRLIFHLFLHTKGIHKVCDLACGHGQLIIRLHKRGYDTTALDLDMDRVRNVKKYFPRAYCRNMEDTKLENSEFDAVLCLHALEHVFHIGEAMQEMSRILRGNGMCFLSVPYRHEIEDSFHVRIFDEENLMALAAQAGFEILYAGRVPYLNSSSLNNILLIARKSEKIK